MRDFSRSFKIFLSWILIVPNCSLIKLNSSDLFPDPPVLDDDGILQLLPGLDHVVQPGVQLVPEPGVGQHLRHEDVEDLELVAYGQFRDDGLLQRDEDLGLVPTKLEARVVLQSVPSPLHVPPHLKTKY